MCEKEPKRRSCTECPQYDGMKCTATDFTLGARDEVLQQEHRRGFICLDTGEAELKGDAVLQWTESQERLRQEKGYKSCEEMWAAEGKQVKSGFRIDEDNEQLEPMLQVSNGPGPVKLTFQYEEKEPGSPSSECPSRREGPPQKGKIAENKAVHNSQRLSVTLSPDATCDNCNKSHTEGDRLVCDRWGLQNILMPYRPCEKWSRNMRASLSTDKDKSAQTTDALKVSLLYNKDQSLKHVEIVPEQEWRELEQSSGGVFYEGSGLQYVENPSPIFTRDFFEPRKKSCLLCKHYTEPSCDVCKRSIGTVQELYTKEETYGFHCFAADDDPIKSPEDLMIKPQIPEPYMYDG